MGLKKDEVELPPLGDQAAEALHVGGLSNRMPRSVVEQADDARPEETVRIDDGDAGARNFHFTHSLFDIGF